MYYWSTWGAQAWCIRVYGRTLTLAKPAELVSFWEAEAALVVVTLIATYTRW